MEKQLVAKNEHEVLLSFLRRTKEGKYAPIEESSLPYSRVVEESETLEILEDEFYFNIS